MSVRVLFDAFYVYILRLHFLLNQLTNNRMASHLILLPKPPFDALDNPVHGWYHDERKNGTETQTKNNSVGQTRWAGFKIQSKRV